MTLQKFKFASVPKIDEARANRAGNKLNMAVYLQK